MEFQFTHPGRGATANDISIVNELGRFNSRTPGGVRRASPKITTSLPMFQFTHPGRGATAHDHRWAGGNRVSIHAPREGCDAIDTARLLLDAVSIHAPREGCDASVSCLPTSQRCFNSRTPGGVRRPRRQLGRSRHSVSIHAPREGCDSKIRREKWGNLQVSIHAPREGCD